MNKLPSRGLQRLADPAIEPVTLVEAKLFLRIDGTAEDSLLDILIKSARENAENFMGLSLITTSWELSIDNFNANDIRLPMRPIQTINTVTQVNSNGDEYILNSSSYSLNAAKDTLQIEAILETYILKVNYLAGYGDNISNIPANIRQGLLGHIAYMYENRESGASIPDISKQLYARYMEVRI